MSNVPRGAFARMAPVGALEQALRDVAERFDKHGNIGRTG
jgi:hypothetical protein